MVRKREDGEACFFAYQRVRPKNGHPGRASERRAAHTTSPPDARLLHQLSGQHPFSGTPPEYRFRLFPRA